MLRSRLSVIVSLFSLLVAVGSVVMLFWASKVGLSANSRLAAATDYEPRAAATETPLPIDPATVQYKQIAQIAIDLGKVVAMAVDADDHIYVAGDKSLCRVSPDGTFETRIALTSEPTCLTVSNRHHIEPGRIYVGFIDHVEKFEADGSPGGVLGQGLGDTARCTSISTSETYVFIADAGQSVIQRFDWSGKLLEPIGASTSGRFTSVVNGNIAPFDVVVGHDDLVYVGNRRDHRVEGFNFLGDLEQHWGQGGPAMEDFAGASNPAHLTIMPDGRFVTAEENPLRVKVYARSSGDVTKMDLKCVVCGPEDTRSVTALATDSHGRILVLDGKARCIRVFEAKNR